MPRIMSGRALPSWVNSAARWGYKWAGYLAYRTLKGRYAKAAHTDERTALACCQAYSPCPPESPVPALAAADPALALSIIVPVYQAEAYVTACLRSILAQETKHPFEVIAVDDGSRDESLARINQLHDSRLRVLPLGQNGGVSRARNAGLAASRGKYVMFVDADDLLLPGALDALMTPALERGADIVQGQYVRFGEKGGRHMAERLPVGEVNNDLGALLRYPGFPCMKVFARALWQGVGFPEGMAYEDTVIWYLLYPRCRRLICVAQTVYAYRINASGATATGRCRPQALDTYWVVLRLLEAQARLNIAPSQAVYDMTLLQMSKYLYTRNAAAPENVLESMFVLACALMAQLRDALPGLRPPKDAVLGAVNQALTERDFGSWRFLSPLLR